MGAVTDESFWREFWRSKAPHFDDSQILFKDIFDRFLPIGGTCIEIGCYPGNFLIYLAKRYGYSVSGLELLPEAQDWMNVHLRSHGVPIDRMFVGDILSLPIERTYDVVCSFGLVEHFRNYAEVIARHAQLVAPGGTLVISCPNFRWLQFGLHYILDRANLQMHVCAAMRLPEWARVARREGLKVLHASYYRTAGFWSEAPAHTLRAKISHRVGRFCSALDSRVDIPNRFISPYMILVARRLDTNNALHTPRRVEQA